MKKTKVLLLNTYDITGGAARAAYRVHKGLRQIGIDSRMMVLDKRSHDGTVTSVRSGFKQKLLGRRYLLDLLPLAFYPRRQWRSTWSIGWKRNDLLRKIARENPDLIHLNWVGRGFVPIRILCQFQVPIIWTLHDMWTFTGGCHFAGACHRYRQSCGRCPQLSSKREKDLSRWIWRQKKQYWEKLDLTLVAPSRWLGECAKISSLFLNHPVEIIPYGLDTSIFKPAHRHHARTIWKFPEKKIILTGGIKNTTDPRKGFHLLKRAANILSSKGWTEKIELVIFGARRPSNPPNMGFNAAYVGPIDNDRLLSSLYAAADVFVAPSRQENLCQTALEALACGIPCVSFKIGGFPDMINHKQNGYLARAFDVHDLAAGMEWALSTSHLRERVSFDCAKKSGSIFSLTDIARRYARLYDAVLKRRGKEANL